LGAPNDRMQLAALRAAADPAIEIEQASRVS
jgi:hypothetical protein